MANIWNLEQLLEQLRRQKLAQWSVQVKDLERQEYYLIQDASQKVSVDQARSVRQSSYSVRVYVSKGNGRAGSAESPFFVNLPLDSQLQTLIDSAHLSDEESWVYPEPKEALVSQPQTVAPAFSEDFAKASLQLSEDLEKAIRSCEQGEFNSAELFVSKEAEREVLSSGFEHRSESSRIYSEVCFSERSKDGQNSEEFLITRWGAHPEQLNFKEMCQQSAQMAQLSLEPQRPEAGTYPVIVPANVLSQLLHDALSHLDAGRKYLSMPFVSQGEVFIPSFEGEAFSMMLDPTIDYGFASHVFDGSGWPQEKVALVENNQVLSNVTTPKMAQYMNWPATSSLGTLVVEASGSPVQDLRRSAPRVLEILQFSGLFTNPMDLTFSSEIRLARLYDNASGKVYEIKGGSLSGNFRENFRGVRWSQESELFNGGSFDEGFLSYKGPSFALLSGVSIAS